MINLQDQCALPVMYDSKEESIIFGNNILLDGNEKVPLKSLIPGLLNKSLVYPVEVYQEYRNIRKIDDNESVGTEVIYDILMLPEGLLGVEYIKSHIYYSPFNSNSGNASTVIEVLMGSLTILMQKNTDQLSFEPQVEDGVYIIAKQGEKVVIPRGYFYTFINTTTQSVIFARTYRNKGVLDYGNIRKEQGLAYFCIRKNARCEFVKNPRYRDIPELRKDAPTNTTKNLHLCCTTPLYSQIVKEMNMFKDLLWA